MAFTAGKQLLGSRIYGTDNHQSLERASHIGGHDRILCLMQKRASVKKGRSRSLASTSLSPPSLSSSAPPLALSSPVSTSPKALTDAFAVHSAIHKGYAVLERDPQDGLSMQSWSEIEGLLTELRRSLLETQWALTSEGQQRTREAADGNSVVRSGLPCARQRRLGDRKQHGVTMAGSSSFSKPFRIRKEKKSRIEEALTTVTTLGLKGRRELLTKDEEVLLSKKMKVGHNLKAARAKLATLLGCEPSDETWASSVNLTVSQVQSRILEADRARDQMFVSNLRLVFSVANKYTGVGVTLSDLIQEGALGLLRGLEKFNHTKGFKLSTYVHWWIRQGITRALADHSRTVRLPAHMHERLSAINRAAASLRLGGASVSVQSLSQAVNLSDEMVTVALKATKKMVSLDKAKKWGQLGAEEDSLHNYIADIRPESDPWIAIDKLCLREDVDYLLAKILNKREREIVRLHYGLDHPNGQGISLEKISHRYGISRERTRQIEGCALRKLAAVGQRMDLDTPQSHS